MNQEFVLTSKSPTGTVTQVVTNEHEESPLRRCREHGEYFVNGRGPHATHDSYPLMWKEVSYYLNKLATLRETFAKLRQELSI